MSRTLKVNASFLQFLLETKSNKQKTVLIENATHDQFKCLIEIVTNFMHPEFPLANKILHKLRRYKIPVRLVADHNTSFKKKKELLTKGIKWLMLILQATAPLIRML